MLKVPIVTIEPQEYEKARNELATFEAQGKGCFYFNSFTRALRKPVLEKKLSCQELLDIQVVTESKSQRSSVEGKREDPGADTEISVLDLEPEKCEKENRLTRRRWGGRLVRRGFVPSQIHPCMLLHWSYECSE